MYSIIIAIHAVFIFLSHLLGFRFFEWIFLLLCIFFLFYFSPLFFIHSQWIEENSGKKYPEISTIFKNFSLRNSLLIPLTLSYTALYGFIIWLFGFWDSFLLIHSVISIGIFIILFWYILSFEWNNDMFYEIFQYHSILSFFSTLLFAIISFFQYTQISIFFLLLGILSVLWWVFFLSISRIILRFYTVLLLSSMISLLFLILHFFFHFHTLSLFLSLVVIFWITHQTVI